MIHKQKPTETYLFYELISGDVQEHKKQERRKKKEKYGKSVETANDINISINTSDILDTSCDLLQENIAPDTRVEFDDDKIDSDITGLVFYYFIKKSCFRALLFGGSIF